MKRQRAHPFNLQFFAQEKTEKATPRKRKEVREKGQVARSSEVPPALILLFSFLLLRFAGDYLEAPVRDIFLLPIAQYALWEISLNNLQVIFLRMLEISLKLVLPFFLIAFVTGLLANAIQVGFLFSTEPLKVKLERINPIQGAKRIFSLRALVELLKSLLKIAFVSLVAFGILWGEREQLLSLSYKPVGGILSYTGGITVKMGLYVAVLLVILSIFDYLYQRYEHEKNIRMSKQEIKDEWKKTEGDPLIRSRIRERQRQFAMRRMMQEIPKADVVITNPTHFAVALKYEMGKMDAPEVVAKGQGYIALKIREVAEKHGIVIMENKPLAQALYKRVEIGETIPEDLFKAVAEVLAYVYRMKGIV